MAQQFPELGESVEAAEGDAAHEIGAQLIKSAAIGGLNKPDRNKLIGQPASNNVILTDEIFDSAEIYAEDVIDVMRSRAIFGGPFFNVETPVYAKKIHDLSYGTPDTDIYDQKKSDLFLWDFKHGYEKVEAFENWQGINYVAGIFERLNINGIADQHLTVHIRIAQPRAFHRQGVIREWKVKGSDLRPYFNILHANAHKALSNDAELKTGTHCKHCSARHACSPALKAGMSLYEIVSKPIPIDLSPEALGVQLAIIKRARKQIEYLESGYDEQVKHLIKSGTDVPGWMIEQGFGNLAWDKPTKEIIAMGLLMEHDLRKPDNVKTPTQAIALGINKSLVNTYASRPKRGVKVIQDDGNKAKQCFK